jgi:uncharacterized phage protein (TIGR02220 family)
MAKDPAFLFYPSDFLMGVMLMNNTDVGIYIKTLCLLHQHGGYLSQKKLETALGVLPVSVIEKLQKNENDELYSRRLIEESIKRNTYCDSRRKNIQKRYEKSTYEPTYVTTDVVHMENRNRNRNKDLNINNNGIINNDIDTDNCISDHDKDKKHNANALPAHCEGNAIKEAKPDLEAPILYLNEKVKRSYSPKNKSNRDLIQARYNEGRTLADFKKVIDLKVSQWLSDEKMFKFLRPETLFNRTKFESYLNEPEPPPEDPLKKWEIKR